MNYRYWSVLIAAFVLVAFPARLPAAVKASTTKSKPKFALAYALGASLFFQQLDGSKVREEKLVLPEKSKIQHLSGSVDGKTLAFSAGRTIYFYNTQSKLLLPVAPLDGVQYLYPSISPDGQSVSCRPYRADATLCILKRDGTVKSLGASTQGATKSRFAMDGKSVYFANGPDFLRISVEGGDATRLVRGYYIENFSVNKQSLVITSAPVDNSNVKPALVGEAGQITLLSFEANDFYNPVWSPDGKSIAFSRRRRYGGEADAQGLYVWENLATRKEFRKISDARSNSESGFVWCRAN